MEVVHVGAGAQGVLVLASSDEIQPRGEGARVGGRVAVGAVGVQVALVFATSSWGKSLAVVHAALVCSSRTRQAATMSAAGRSARRRDAREQGTHQTQKGSNHARQNNWREAAPKHRGGKKHTGGNSPQGNPTRQQAVFLIQRVLMTLVL